MGSVSPLGLETFALDVLNILKILNDYVIESNNSDFFPLLYAQNYLSLSRDHLKLNTLNGFIRKKNFDIILSDLLWGNSKVKNVVILFCKYKASFSHFILSELFFLRLLVLPSSHIMFISGNSYRLPTVIH